MESVPRRVKYVGQVVIMLWLKWYKRTEPRATNGAGVHARVKHDEMTSDPSYSESAFVESLSFLCLSSPCFSLYHFSHRITFPSFLFFCTHLTTSPGPPFSLYYPFSPPPLRCAPTHPLTHTHTHSCTRTFCSSTVAAPKS